MDYCVRSAMAHGSRHPRDLVKTARISFKPYDAADAAHDRASLKLLRNLESA
jgi:hypothetical protein